MKQMYILAQFPYPSGSLHMGHARIYTITDALSRHYRMRGHTIKCPMGWDAFGLPAENAARLNQKDPKEWTSDNIKKMRMQMDRLGLQFDWQDEINTSEKEYYRWTGELFKRMFARGLAYKKEAPVNWDPVDQTVLADEQVDNQGRSWRSGAVVEKRLMSQWFLGITKYADRLLDDLDTVDWPTSVKQMQRDWIGRRVFYREKFQNGDKVFELELEKPVECVEKFKTRIDGLDKLRLLRDPSVQIPCEYDPNVLERIQIIYKPSSIMYNEQDLIKSNGGLKVEKTFKMRDWLISRQRKWGTPIPVKYCSEHGPFTSDTTCCLNGTISFETDTMDTFVDSSWYFMRFCDPRNQNLMFSPEQVKMWMPVSVYVGGVEHAILHLLYARFVYKFLLDEFGLNNLLPKEPFERLLTQGMVMGRTFKCPDSQRYLNPGEYELSQTSGTEVAVLPNGKPALIDWEKMSKSKFNGVDPVMMVERYGVDAVRLAILFKAPAEYPLYWDERDVKGHVRFLTRLLSMAQTVLRFDNRELTHTGDKAINEAVKDCIRQVERDMGIEKHQFHTAIAALMKLSNKLSSCLPKSDDPIIKDSNNDYKRPKALKPALQALAQMLYPFAPYTACELGEMLECDVTERPNLLLTNTNHQETTVISVQVNGKTIGKVECPIGSDQAKVEGMARKYVEKLTDKKRIVYVPDRVINYVV